MEAYSLHLPDAYNSRSADLAPSRTRKRGKGSAREGDKGKKAKTAPDAPGGKSVSEKSQPTGGKVSEKSHFTAITQTTKTSLRGLNGPEDPILCWCSEGQTD